MYINLFSYIHFMYFIYIGTKEEVLGRHLWRWLRGHIGATQTVRDVPAKGPFNSSWASSLKVWASGLRVWGFRVYGLGFCRFILVGGFS